MKLLKIKWNKESKYKKINDFVYFTFPFINYLYFFHFKLMIILLVYNMSYWIFFGSLVNHEFSNLKLNVFTITGFICSNRYRKQVVLINHSSISPHITKEMGIGFLLILQKMGECIFCSKEGDVRKIVEEGFWRRVTYVFC